MAKTVNNLVTSRTSGKYFPIIFLTFSLPAYPVHSTNSETSSKMTKTLKTLRVTSGTLKTDNNPRLRTNIFNFSNNLPYLLAPYPAFRELCETPNFPLQLAVAMGRSLLIRTTLKSFRHPRRRRVNSRPNSCCSGTRKTLCPLIAIPGGGVNPRATYSGMGREEF